MLINVSGIIRRSDYDSLTKKFNEATKESKKISIMLEVDGLEGIEPGVIIRDFEFGKAEGPKIKKMAIVTDKKWLTNLVSFIKNFFSEQERTFTLEEKQDAITWPNS